MIKKILKVILRESLIFIIVGFAILKLAEIQVPLSAICWQSELITVMNIILFFGYLSYLAIRLVSWLVKKFRH